jgi:microsomal dipeptidase-like Zn-dependent dipeptidase
MQLGYSDSDIRKIMGQNMLRVMRANEAVSKKMAAKLPQTF